MSGFPETLDSIRINIKCFTYQKLSSYKKTKEHMMKTYSYKIKLLCGFYQLFLINNNFLFPL